MTEIGRGGCSVVYRALEVDTGRWVAIKVIDAVGASTPALESFQRETLALGALGDHPHIVTLYRALGIQERRPALVLELCTGSLGQQSETGGPMAARRVTAIGVKIAGALETAHRAGLLHLDVKPSNILITQYGEPALADFGLALLRAPETGPSTLIGLTTAHAAPEMLSGAPATPATDVYQLASTLYHLLTGQPAFRGFDGEQAASIAHRVLYGAVEPILDPAVPRTLTDLVMWAMAKEPTARPVSAAAFADALRAVELSCRWTPTAPAVPGGHLPRLTQQRFDATDGQAALPGQPPPGFTSPSQPAGRRPTYLTTRPPLPHSWSKELKSHLPAPPESDPAPPATLPTPLPVELRANEQRVATQLPSAPPPPPPPNSSVAAPAGMTPQWSDPEPTMLRQGRRHTTGLDAIAPREKRNRRFARKNRPKAS